MEKENIIRKATKYDFDFIYQLWRRNTKVLGAAFKQNIQKYIEDGEIIMIDNVGFCYYHRNRNSSYMWLEILCIDESARGKGYGKMFLDEIAKQPLPVVLEAVDGAPNNKFYDKHMKLVGTLTRGKSKMLLRRYILEKESFNNLLK